MTKKLEALRDDLKRQIQELEQRLYGVEMSIKALNGDVDAPKSGKAKAPRPNVKRALLDLLAAVGEAGLNAASAVELAQKRGDKLERGTVSSLLSRFKADGIVTHDGMVYRIVKGVKPLSDDQEDDRADSVH